MSVRKRHWNTATGAAKEGWIVDYHDVQGRRRHKSFRLKKEADAFELRAKGEVREGIHVADAASATVEEAARNWLLAVKQRGRERSTSEQYRQHVDLHIVPLIGATRLTALSVPAVAAFEKQLRNEGRSPALTKKVLVSLGSLLDQAREDQLVARNVVRERGRRRADSRAEKRAKGKLRVGVDIPTLEEARAFLANLKGRWRPLLLTLVFTGLRASELRGLSWADVDLENKVIHVRQRADRFNDIGKPKSEAGERQVPLAPVVVNTLREWRFVCPKRNAGPKEKPVMVLDLVFPNGQGKVESLGNIINRGLMPAMVAAGVSVDTGERDEEGKPVRAAKYTGLHSLRHFYASWCINRRVDGGLELPAKVVQERLGHATINLTLDTYSHLFPRGDDAEELAAAERSLLG